MNDTTEAIDVIRAIDQLRRDLSGYHGQLKAHDDLKRHCENQRRRIAELEGLYFKAKTENAKLREMLAELYKCSRQVGCDHCGDGWRRTCNVLNYLRELGMEVVV